MLRFQVQEIEQAGLLPDEEERLRSERQRLVHAHRLRELAHEAHVELQADEQAVLSRLGRIGRTLAELAQTDPTMSDCEQTATESAISLKDLAGRLRDYAQQLEADPDRQAVVEDRLDLIQRLKKKYGGSVEAVLAAERWALEEMRALDNREERTAELTARLDEETRRLRALAQQLSKKRVDAAKRMTTLVGAELAALEMEQAIFQVLVSIDESPRGLDRPGAIERSSFFQAIPVNRRDRWAGLRPAGNSHALCWRSRRCWPRWTRFRSWYSMKSIRESVGQSLQLWERDCASSDRFIKYFASPIFLKSRPKQSTIYLWKRGWTANGHPRRPEYSRGWGEKKKSPAC